MEEDRRAAAAIALSQLGGHGAVGAESDADNYISVDDYDIDDVNVNLNDDNEDSDGGDHENEEMPPPSQEGRGEKTKYKSDIFVKHFKKVPIVSSANEVPVFFMAYCNYCTKKYKFKKSGGYGSLIRHMQTIHPELYGHTASQTQLNFQSASAHGSASGSSQTGTPSSALLRYDHKHTTDVMAKFAAMHHLPFGIYDNQDYEDSMKECYNLNSKRLPRTSIQRSTKNQYYEMKKDLSQYLSNLGHKVNICSDIWTDAFQKHAYIGITVHFMDNSWSLNKRLIAFRDFPTPHTANAIAFLIIQVLNEYQLCNKVFSIAFDNATANTASISDLIDACSPIIDGKYFHQRCVCHILNLCVQDALSLWQKHVDPIRNAVRAIHFKLGKAWKKYCRNRNIRYTTFIMDVSTRWNSTYDCLNSTLEHRDALCDFFRTNPYGDIVLTPNCWDQSMSLCQLFKAFKSATVELSGVYYCTSVRVLEHCMYIALGFKTCMKNARSRELMCVLFYMIEKWLKYFSEIPTVFLIAKCLDPKWKLAGTTKILDFYYQNLRSIDLSPLQNLPFDDNETSRVFELTIPDRSLVQAQFESSLRTLFAEYEEKYNRTHQIHPRTQHAPQPQQYGGFGFAYDDPDAQSQLADLYGYGTSSSSRSTSMGSVSELDFYLEARHHTFSDAGPTPAQIDVLEWWGTHEKDYPILASMAKEIFAVPASTVAVESAFSVGACVLDVRRSKLSARNMEAVMLLDDWGKAARRAQEPDWDAREESEETFTDTEDEGGE